MSDAIKHECGIALVRLLKPLEFYQQKYGSACYGLSKLCLLMEKQHNRGQDGAGVAVLKLDVEPCNPYIAVEKSNSQSPIKEIFRNINADHQHTVLRLPQDADCQQLKQQSRFLGEIMLGHLRYGTFGRNGIDACHPFSRENNWMSRNLVIAGNFNLTNVDELFNILVGVGQHPKEFSDTVTILEKIGHFLDEENDSLYHRFRKENVAKQEISAHIAQALDVHKVLENSCRQWDGGYVIAGLIGHGDAFVIRDPAGIRPCHYYCDDEVVVIASERPTIQTAFNVEQQAVRELEPGQAIVIKKDGDISFSQFKKPLPRRSCSFERIYFSRGNDADIYHERKRLGRLLTPAIMKSIYSDNLIEDISNTVFSYIPNTAESCFFGMIKEMEKHCSSIQRRYILNAEPRPDEETLREILTLHPRIDKIAIKDVKLRTFISDDSQRNELAAHVYDITYGIVKEGIDNLVVIDDSIVRGTTMRESILKMLWRTKPKKIVIVSSAPQIRYPDCYGIDMARLGRFIAFEAAISLLKSSGRESVLREVYEDAKYQLTLPPSKMENAVKRIYEPFTTEEISQEIARLLTPPEVKCEVEFVYQSIENLHQACPDHLGDWYFTGNYPTFGGNKVVNQSYINYIEGSDARAY